MNFEKLIELESKRDFDDVNAIRRSGIHSFLDEWIVMDLLGRGSFGNVYRIVKPQSGVKVHESALKVCQVNTPADADLRKQEIETQLLLSGHPNAVQIEDYAIISREPPRVSYLLIRMELLSPIPEDGMSEHDTIQMGIDISSVLDACSRQPQKVVHCDIKPANILLTSDGRYKLGDFGTAKTLRATMTYTGNRGTPLYMAPEVSAFGTGYDCRCDIFSLGYTMLTTLNNGKHPYENKDNITDMYSRHNVPAVKGVSSSLMKIIRKMCDPNPQARYQTAGEIKRALQLLVRKQKEAEEKARIESDKRVALEKQRLKAERTKNIKLADSALSKAEHELKTARNALDNNKGDKARLNVIAKAAERKYEFASQIKQMVYDGDTYDEAFKKLREQEKMIAKYANVAGKRRHPVIVALASLIVILALTAGAWIILDKVPGSSNVEPDLELPAVSDDTITGSEVSSSDSAKDTARVFPVITTPATDSTSGTIDQLDGYYAYMSCQTNSSLWIFRLSVDDATYGVGMTDSNGKIAFNGLSSMGSDGNIVRYAGTFADAKLDGDGRYTVSLVDPDFEQEEYLSLLYVSTNIPLEAGITFSNFTVRINNKTVWEEEAAYQNPDNSVYNNFILQNLWNSERRDLFYITEPYNINSIEISFDVTGFGYYAKVSPAKTETPKFDYYCASSSYNKDENNNTVAYDAFDDDINTCWQDGVAGYGEGETLTADADSPQLVSYVEIRNGFQNPNQASSLYTKNSRAKVITVLYEGGQKSFTLKDEKDWQRLYLDEPVETTYMTIRIDSVYEGSTYEDTCISDIRFG